MTDTQRKIDGLEAYAPRGLAKAGVRAWLLIGVAAVVLGVAAFFSYTSSLFIPLMIAVIIGVLFFPLVERLSANRIPRVAAAGLVMVLLFAIVGATLWLVVRGIVLQAPVIQAQIEAGMASLQDWFTSLNIPAETITNIQAQAQKAFSSVASGIAGFVASGLSGTVAFLFGVFLGTFMLFYLLTDWRNIEAYVAQHLGLPSELGAEIVADAALALRQYFRGVTITGLAVAVTIGIALVILDVPLAFTIAVVTFLTAYIPYFGAIFSGAFAFIIALGTPGGIQTAVLVLVIILLAQNVLQTVVQNMTTSQTLAIHPLVNLIATILGGLLGGLLGAVLGAPTAAVAVRTTARLKAANAAERAPEERVGAVAEG